MGMLLQKRRQYTEHLGALFRRQAGRIYNIAGQYRSDGCLRSAHGLVRLFYRIWVKFGISTEYCKSSPILPNSGRVRQFYRILEKFADFTELAADKVLQRQLVSFQAEAGDGAFCFGGNVGKAAE